MKKRLITVILFAGTLPVLAMTPIWGIVYIFTGRFILSEYLEFLDNQIEL